MNKVIAGRRCAYCNAWLEVYYNYPKKKYCTAKCRSLDIPMPPRPDVTGQTPWNKGLTKDDDKRIKKLSDDRYGINNPNWIHGNSKAHRTMWATSTHKNWRKAVFVRDNYTCVICRTPGLEIQADHIKCFAHNPNNRYDVKNGRTLCISCHKNTNNFGMHKKEDC